MICQTCGGAGRRVIPFRRTMVACKTCKGSGQVREPIKPVPYDRYDDEGRTIKRLSDEDRDE